MKRLALALAAPVSAAAITPKALARILPTDRAQDLAASAPAAGTTILELLIVGIVLVVATTLVLAGRRR